MLECIDVSLRYGSVQALAGASLTLSARATGAVIGPSGSGKSTLLRVITGLERPDAGSVRWAGAALDGVPAHQRGFGLMFQDYALFPHLDVAANIGFSLDVAGWPPATTERRVDELLELVGLEGFAGRTVDRLSGGEQQRVALARTLASSPQLVLLDEPLGALDRALRDELLPEMRRIFTTLGSTVLYVTHDHDEAFAVANEVFVMRSGELVGHGTPEELWRRPPDLETARFFGFEPEIAAVVSSGVADLEFGSLAVDVADGSYVAAFAPGAAVLDPAGNVSATVMTSRYTTQGHVLMVEAAGHRLGLRSPGHRSRGETVALSLSADRIALYPQTSSPSNSSV